jgi:sterol desaturase/sphingolipid hydroxylase (fatty acid hydroxylase superfamily)
MGVEIEKEKESEIKIEQKSQNMSSISYLLSILIIILFFGGSKILATLFWPKKIENEKLFYFVFGLILHKTIFTICNLFYFILYKLESKYVEIYKVHELPWPWKDNYKEWKELLKSSVKIIGFNQFIIIPLFALGNLMLKKEAPMRMDYPSLPNIFEIIWQLFFIMIINDFLFYWLHRFLHWKPIYPHFHKIHHQYRNTVSIASEHTHPVEFIFQSIIPANVGAIILGHRLHFYTYCLWIIIKICKTSEEHSGYQFPWSPTVLIPFRILPEFHNLHHLYFTGNYGLIFNFWDNLCSTVNPKYLEYVEKKDKKRE